MLPNKLLCFDKQCFCPESSLIKKILLTIADYMKLTWSFNFQQTFHRVIIISFWPWTYGPLGYCAQRNKRLCVHPSPHTPTNYLTPIYLENAPQFSRRTTQLALLVSQILHLVPFWWFSYFGNGCLFIFRLFAFLTLPYFILSPFSQLFLFQLNSLNLTWNLEFSAPVSNGSFIKKEISAKFLPKSKVVTDRW